MKKALLIAAALFVIGLLAVVMLFYPFGEQGPGVISGDSVPDEVIDRRQKQIGRAAGQSPSGADNDSSMILFGDLHVHTTFSGDAYLLSLPLMQGQGLHPPADACDFARYCSQLDFFALTDHAEFMTPARWDQTQSSLRACRDRAGDPEDPDLIPMIGWEWTQVGREPSSHYGHKNVILRELDPDHVPARPIGASAFLFEYRLGDVPNLQEVLATPLDDFENRRDYIRLVRYMYRTQSVPPCNPELPTTDLPKGCREVADTPGELFDKLNEWDVPALVIPHGTTWGFYTPPGSDWEKQLTPQQHDPNLQRLIEVYSGHGNSEEFRSFQAVEMDSDQEPMCPEPTEEYLPCCWRAGEIIRSRCEAPASTECERRVEKARLDYLHAGIAGHLTIPGTDVEDWQDCGQCRDCFGPAFNYRPRGSAQYIAALRRQDQPEGHDRFNFGFIASSDNHSARPGTGYKEYGRHEMTEVGGVPEEEWQNKVILPPGEPAQESVSMAGQVESLPFGLLTETERQASFFLTGGLVGVHADHRSRESLWQALRDRRVYGTSGPRILLWFDLVDEADGVEPMGSSVSLAEPPTFRVKALGAWEQKEGCPAWTGDGLSEARRKRLCMGECYNPGGSRVPLDRIEVVRIFPQNSPDEDPAELIEDPWRTFECDAGRDLCIAEFSDDSPEAAERDALYYVRAIQQATPAVNGAGLRCTYDESGRCVELNPCYGDYRTPYEEECLAPIEERAWSSPIFVQNASIDE